METTSRDGTTIHYEVTGSADTALVFVHGWMGNVRWWDAQRDAFAADHRVVTIDLAGHGQSGRTRTEWTGEAYAEDIVAVVRAVGAPSVVLVGHSMAGVYAIAAAPQIPGLAAVFVIDTVKNVDAIPSAAQAAPLFASYRADYPRAVATTLRQMLFGPRTPAAVIERLDREFLAVSGDVAVTLLEPLYRFDLRTAARRVTVPVRGIGTGPNRGNAEVNRSYFGDYTYEHLDGDGHYPMLEVPEAFNAALRTQLRALRR